MYCAGVQFFNNLFVNLNLNCVMQFYYLSEQN